MEFTHFSRRGRRNKMGLLPNHRSTSAARRLPS
jgi:hypothetical protein